jgi:hypothetical protein
MKRKLQLPMGVYLVIVYLAVVAALGFFDDSQFHTMFLVGTLVAFVLSLGLLAKSAMASKLIVGWSLVMILASLAGFYSFSKNMKNLNQELSRSDAILVGVRERFTDEQLAAFKAQDKKITNLRKETGTTEKVAYLKYGAVIIGYSAILLYLTQPALRKTFSVR